MKYKVISAHVTISVDEFLANFIEYAPQYNQDIESVIKKMKKLAHKKYLELNRVL